MLRLGVGAADLQAGLIKALDFATTVASSWRRRLASSDVRRVHGDRGGDAGRHRTDARLLTPLGGMAVLQRDALTRGR